jgi:hypothetical protein
VKHVPDRAPSPRLWVDLEVVDERVEIARWCHAQLIERGCGQPNQGVFVNAEE